MSEKGQIYGRNHFDVDASAEDKMKQNKTMSFSDFFFFLILSSGANRVYFPLRCVSIVP